MSKEENPSKNEKSSSRRPHLMKEKDYTALADLFRHHIESFDYMVDQGLEIMLNNIKPVEIFNSSTNQKLKNICFYILFFFF